METMPPDERMNRLRNPKVVFGFILFLAVIGVGASGYRIASGIWGGFVPSETNGTGVNAPSYSIEGDLALKSKDTDGDTLSDYDELQMYKTSPYLTDSDSDGVGDAGEVAKGSDPNCQEGRDCREVAPTGTADSSDIEQDITTQATEGLSTSDRSDTSNTSDRSQTTDTVELTTEAEANAQLKNLTAAQIRQLLLDSGKVTEEQLRGIDDETLMKVYQEVIVNNP